MLLLNWTHARIRPPVRLGPAVLEGPVSEVCEPAHHRVTGDPRNCRRRRRAQPAPTDDPQPQRHGSGEGSSYGDIQGLTPIAGSRNQLAPPEHQLRTRGDARRPCAPDDDVSRSSAELSWE